MPLFRRLGARSRFCPLREALRTRLSIRDSRGPILNQERRPETLLSPLPLGRYANLSVGSTVPGTHNIWTPPRSAVGNLSSSQFLRPRPSPYMSGDRRSAQFRRNVPCLLDQLTEDRPVDNDCL